MSRLGGADSGARMVKCVTACTLLMLMICCDANTVTDVALWVASTHTTAGSVSLSVVYAATTTWPDRNHMYCTLPGDRHDFAMRNRPFQHL